MEKDFNNMPPYMDFNYKDMNMNPDYNSIYAADPIANPIMQYEQAYSYYRYLNMQMDYKIKCKEYELMCGNSSSNEKREIR